MTVDERRQERMLGVMPVLMALAVHATSHSNVWVAGSMGILLAVLVLRDMSLSPAPVRLWLLGGGGFAAGSLMSFLGVTTPAGPLPPMMWFGFVGALLLLTCEFVATRRIAASLGTSVALVMLSLNVELTGPVTFALCIFIASFLASTAALAGTMRMDLRFLLPFGAFVTTSTLLTIGIANGVQRWGGTLDRALSGLFADNRAVPHVGMGQDILLVGRHSLTTSWRPLVELSTPVARLRTQVLDTFDGKRWTTSRELLTSTRTLKQVPVRPEFARSVDLTILADLNGRLPAPAAIWRIQGATPRIDGAWTMWEEQMSRFVTMTGDVDELLPVEPSPAELLLELPDELRRELAPIAREVVGDARSARDKALRLQRFFRENFAYSLDTDLVGAQHPLVILVSQRRAASCSYFASAMAVMLRSQGVPTRVAAGLVPEEVNPLTGRVIVRERDAHAWVEAWIPEQGRFVPFDPTPWQSRNAVMGLAARPGIMASLYDAGVSLLRRVSLAVRHDPREMMKRLVRSPWLWLSAALVAALWWWSRRAVRPPRPSRRQWEADDPVLRSVYARYLDSLRRAGIQALPCESDEELLARLAELRGAELALRARHFVDRYRQARFRGGPRDADLATLAALS